ncbi:hypothetical protein [Vibrio azureus]|uniref:hypothetical protein n=1 Tax=Vibrio azureus TaxID=512649 RepID=UPI0003A5B1A9|nr:hypothetical protein [Vibrio azureus]
MDLVLVAFAFSRPELPKDGVFTVFHTCSELVEYEQIKAMKGQNNAIAVPVNQFKN